MEVRAVAKYIRISPRKARLVVDAIRGKSVHEALVYLQYSKKAIARDVSKLVSSAAANAEELYEIGDIDGLVISKAFVDGGPMLKRFRARSRGMAVPRLRRLSHITVYVTDGMGQQDNMEE